MAMGKTALLPNGLTILNGANGIQDNAGIALGVRPLDFDLNTTVQPVLATGVLTGSTSSNIAGINSRVYNGGMNHLAVTIPLSADRPDALLIKFLAALPQNTFATIYTVPIKKQAYVLQASMFNSVAGQPAILDIGNPAGTPNLYLLASSGIAGSNYFPTYCIKMKAGDVLETQAGATAAGNVSGIILEEVADKV